MFIIKKQLLIGLFLVPLFSYGQDFLSVCDRTPEIRDLIMEKVAQIDSTIECNDDDLLKPILIEINFLESFKNFPSFTEMTLKAGDFSGLPNLYTISIQGYKIPSLPQGLFSNLPKLETLVLSNNKTSSLSQDIFSNLPKLRTLDLSHNRITFLHEEAFSGTSNLARLDLSDNLLTSLPDSILSGDVFTERSRSHGKNLNIKGNLLNEQTTRRLVMNLQNLSNKGISVVR